MVTHAFAGLSVSSGIFIPLLLTGAAWGRFVGAALEEVGLPIMRMSNSLIIVETFRSYQPATSAMLILVNMLFLEQLQCSGEWWESLKTMKTWIGDYLLRWEWPSPSRSSWSRPRVTWPMASPSWWYWWWPSGWATTSTRASTTSTSSWQECPFFHGTPHHSRQPPTPQRWSNVCTEVYLQYSCLGHEPPYYHIEHSREGWPDHGCTEKLFSQRISSRWRCRSWSSTSSVGCAHGIPAEPIPRGIRSVGKYSGHHHHHRFSKWLIKTYYIFNICVNIINDMWVGGRRYYGRRVASSWPLASSSSLNYLAMMSLKVLHLATIPFNTGGSLEKQEGLYWGVIKLFINCSQASDRHLQVGVDCDAATQDLQWTVHRVGGPS